jgi:hypothetical protein
MTIILTTDEVAAVTGYRTPKRQLAELHRQGFYRARIGATGNVIVERAHCDAVSAGAKPAKEPAVRNPFEPKLRLA